MIFNSLPFVAFLVVVFTLYWLPLSRSRRHQNIVLLIASYVFYGWWDPRFLTLLVFSSLVDYFMGLKIASTNDPRMRRTWLWISMSANLGLLFFFKYFNFFVSSFKLAFGLPDVPSTLDIILPVGISFYTFQTMSYTIDVYRRQLEPTRDMVDFLTFVSFFPQLVAGPIERARTLLPQISASRVFSHDNAVIGCRWILLGAFKKIVIADRIAPIVDNIFASPAEFSGWISFLGLVLFIIQVYGDFSGYSDIALGTAKLFNIHLMINFDRPYFATSFRKLWGRWHISLMTWFRDYVYTPLGGWRTAIGRYRNILITFGLSGLWHGAKWTFIVWGILHGLFLIVEQSVKYDKLKWPAWSKWAITMFLFTITSVFFRADSMEHALKYLRGIFTDQPAWSALQLLIRRTDITIFSLVMTVLLVTLLMVIDKFSEKKYWIERFRNDRYIRYPAYGIMILLIGFFGVFTDTKAFIYFQF
jgi:D-alanyl-lipoteichoic acid acyltransferase DltB (MBOAT superfamily)